MFIISTNSGNLSNLQEQALKYAARMNNTKITDINILYGKLETISEDGDNQKYLEMIDVNEIVIYHYDSDKKRVTIKEVN